MNHMSVTSFLDIVDWLQQLLSLSALPATLAKRCIYLEITRKSAEGFKYNDHV